MAERNTFVDVVDGDQLNQGYFNGILTASIKSILQDQTGGSIASSTTPTELGEVEIPANIVDSGVLVIATGKVQSTAAAGNNGVTFKLYGGTSATATSNTLFKTVSRTVDDGSNSIIIVYWVTGLTWSSLNYINIVGENGINHVAAVTVCESIVCVNI